jgi:hypothetical protein
MELSSYVYSELREGELTLFRDSHGGCDPILLVVPEQNYTAPECAKRLEDDYTLGTALETAWAAGPVALANNKGRTALVVEDTGGEPLDRLLGLPMDVRRFLHIADPIAAALQLVHERGPLHKNVKPAKVLVDIASGGDWFTDFDSASLLPRKRQAPRPPDIAAGTLAYGAKPEGMRLALSISRRIIEDHHGTLWDTRNEDNGATTHFALPRAAGENYEESRTNCFRDR